MRCTDAYVSAIKTFSRRTTFKSRIFLSLSDIGNETCLTQAYSQRIISNWCFRYILKIISYNKYLEDVTKKNLKINILLPYIMSRKKTIANKNKNNAYM